MKKLKNVKHGECINGISKIYSVWAMMIQRITNKKNHAYKYYGGRGISVCAEWMTPMNFINWAKANGYVEGLQLDRIDCDGNYEQHNCRFVTRHENILNRRKRKDFGIYKRGKYGYQVELNRHGRNIYIGYSNDIDIARKMRDDFLNENKLDK